MNRIQEPMKWSVLVVLSVGMGLAVSFWNQQPRAEAQPVGPKWEYQVVAFPHAGDYRTDPDGKTNAAKFTNQLSALAADGWEYVGPVCNPSSYSRGFVAFKRPKR